VRDRNFGLNDGKRAGAGQSLPLESDDRTAARRPPDHDLAKMHPPPSGAERFHRRFLGREPAGEVLREGIAMPPRLDLPGGVDPVEETIPPPVDRRGDACDLDQIDSEQQRQTLASSIPK
jgi:hypothetical protein